MARVNFIGLAGNISDLNANFTQLYLLRELISDAGYTAATPKLSIATGNWVVPAPASGTAWTLNGVAGAVTFAISHPGTAAAFSVDGTGANGSYYTLSTSGVVYADIGTQTNCFGSGGTGNLGINARGATELGLGANNIKHVTLTATGDFRIVTATGGLGYGTGSGGAVTQATSKSTGVTLNKSNGAITMNAASLAATTSVSFTLTNSIIAATDVVVPSIKSGATAASYLVQVDATAAGSCVITLRNYTGGALAEAVVINFVVIKAVVA